ncbi:TonB-dependent receptor [Sandaracinobacteroides saxicola]|uniref:TonB-dependent receptor n=1 Tax=Sandaracinobacteroides saxicola TaxID=2759707 RepID=A0A7G5ILX6_9SPHN|nr:TonB-dependent receptor [Sandaracinobacteroides saxicola]QMW24368.1 TonB-dependent receptor [Sandaracinobacteroides saxicola]
MVAGFRAALLLSSMLAAPVLAQGAPSPAVTAAADAEEIVVYGRGEVRQQAVVTAADIAVLTPGSSAFKAIEKLPGVNFQSADPFGVYEWSTRISLRGFNQNQLGFTLDGVPLGDMSYGNTNGLHISRAIISDNIATTKVSQGAGALGTASTSNLGGTIEFISREPGADFGMAANATYGSENTFRGFLRLDSGDLGGFRASLSYAYLDAGKWKGSGQQRSHQVNAKATYGFGDSGKVTAFVNFTDRKENDYQDLSLDMIRRLGYDWDNVSSNWPLAVRVAYVGANTGYTGVSVAPNGFGTVYPAPFANADDAYYDAGGLRRDWLTGLKVESKLGEAVTASVQGYYHSNKGQGSWFTPYAVSPSGGIPIAFRTTEYDISRWGVIGTLAGEFGAHRPALTLWYENNDFNQARRFYDIGSSLTAPNTTALTYQSNPFFTQWYNAYTTRTLQFSVQDQWDVTDDFTLSAGFKGQSVKLRADAIAPSPGPLALGRIKNEDLFLPQVGALYRLGGGTELFANFTANQRAFTAAATSGPFATTQLRFDAIRNRLRPEKSNTVEGGVRFGEGAVRGVVAVYYVNFKDRLLIAPVGAGIEGRPPVLANVGNVRSLGVETGVTWRIMPPLTLTLSYAYNESTYRNNVVDDAGAVLQAIRGKRVVDSPDSIGNLDIAYDDGAFQARAGANWMSRRYFTYSNDQSVPGRVLVDASIGYRINGTGSFADGFAIQASVTNLFDKRYVSTIGSNGYGFSGDNQTLMAGAPRQAFVTVKKEF